MNRLASSPGLRPPSPPFAMEGRAGEGRCTGSWRAAWITAITLALLVSFAPTLLGDAGLELFERSIRPVLIDRCYECHGTSSGLNKGNLDLSTKEGWQRGGNSGRPAIVPGKPEESLLFSAISHTNPDLSMPPHQKGAPLTPEQIHKFEQWIRLGAPDPRSGNDVRSESKAAQPLPWSFAPIRHHNPPRVNNERWISTPIDRFILATLEREGIQPSPEATRRTLIRRLSFDLHGLPPTFDEVEAFVRDRSTDAYERLVDRLLASTRYGERWGRHWLDVARYADTKGYVYGDREETRFVHSHAYRDWVVRAHNEDLPFDRFLKLQIAADTLATSSADLAALGFLTLGKRFLGVMHDIIDDRIDVVSRGMQGLTVTCARCHDHKFDPISTQDYYSLYGIFSSSYEQLAPLREFYEAGSEKAALRELRSRQDKLASTLQSKREALSDRLRSQVSRYVEAIPLAASFPTEEFYELRGTNDLNPIFVRRWAVFVERALATNHPVFLPWKTFVQSPPDRRLDTNWIRQLRREQLSNPAILDALDASPPRTMDQLASTYAKVFGEADRAWRACQANPSPPSALADAGLEAVRQVFYGPSSPMAVPNGAVVEVEWFFDEPTRVELSKLQAEIDRWLIKIAPSNALPHTVVLKDKAEPKPGRVFRRGNPAMPGEEVPPRFLSALDPTFTPFRNGSGRAELAARIAARENPLTARVFVNRVWTHHFGQGLVATPSDFGSRSQPPTHPELLDWIASWFMENGWSMKSLHKLMVMSKTYRQSSTDRKDGLSRDPENRWLWRMPARRLDWESLHDSMLFASGELDTKLGGFATKPGSSRSLQRSLYQTIDRQFLPGQLRVFDFANPDLHTPARPGTTVPQQALFFFNSKFAADRSRALAARSNAGSNPSELFKLALQREPTSQEQANLSAFLTEVSDLPKLEPKQPASRAWSYGFGSADPSASNRIAFRPLPHFVEGSWQGGPQWPDQKLGWVRLTAAGGHPGNDHHHAAILRWTAPESMRLEVQGKLTHSAKEGDGIKAWIIRQEREVLGTWTIHNRSQEISKITFEVKTGEWVDFVVDHGPGLSHDDYLWSPALVELNPKNGAKPRVWDSKKDFSGPPEAYPKPFTPAEQLAQVIFSSNEFIFVD